MYYERKSSMIHPIITVRITFDFYLKVIIVKNREDFISAYWDIEEISGCRRL